MPERPAQGQTKRSTSSYSINFFVLAVRLPLEKIVAHRSACRYRRVGARGVEIPGFAAEPNVDAREGAWRQAIPHVHDPQRHRLDHGEAEPCHRRARVGLAQSFDTRERLKVVDMGS